MTGRWHSACSRRLDHPSDLVWITHTEHPLLSHLQPHLPAAWLQQLPPPKHAQASSSPSLHDPWSTHDPAALRAYGNQLYLKRSYIDALYMYEHALAALVPSRAAASPEATSGTSTQAGSSPGQVQLTVDLINNCAAVCLSLGTVEAGAAAVGYARRAMEHAACAGGGHANAAAVKAQLRLGKALVACSRWPRSFMHGQSGLVPQSRSGY